MAPIPPKQPKVIGTAYVVGETAELGAMVKFPMGSTVSFLEINLKICQKSFSLPKTKMTV